MELNVIKEKSQKSEDQDQNRPDKPLLRFILRGYPQNHGKD